MSISRGTRFGPYEVAEPIGIGGMGEVYLARDTQLGRDVAIKVLPAALSSDAMRVARFEQEAKTLATLNHANIAHIYGLERGDAGSTGIVMELVEGPTLADKLLQAPIAVPEALDIARQLADALEAAHGRGIVHRDLKPANIKLKPDGTVKVLDFGIAKALDTRGLTGPGPAALTTPAMTEAGIVLGTAAYMSPEQARGRAVDQRADVWSFGCVLYEMLTGRGPFLGEDVTSTLARVLEVRADWNALPSGVSPAVRRTLELCLEKDVQKRIADMRDVKLALAGVFATSAPEQSARLRLLPTAAAILAALLVGGAGAWLVKPAPVPEPKVVTRFDYALPAGVDLRVATTSVLSIAPNGELVAFNGTGGIYVRRMGDVEAHVIPGTAEVIVGADYPDVVISPDAREVAFFRGPPGKLLRVPIEGGTSQVVADVAPVYPFGLSWEPDGTMFYGQPDGIWRVPQSGGTPEHVVKTEAPEQAYGPHLLPGGEWLLFTATKAGGLDRWTKADIVLQSLKNGERRVLRSGGFDARYLPTGHITYIADGALVASTFDVASLDLGDERVALVQGVRVAEPPAGGSGFYAVANNGTLAFIPETVRSAVGRTNPRRRLVWVDRAGNATALPAPPDDYTMARLSPDGSKIALVVGTTFPVTDPRPDIYVFDVEAETLAQLTFDSRGDDGPVWSRDGSRIYYRSNGEDENLAAVHVLPADGGPPEVLLRGRRPFPWSVSPDGKTLLLVDAKSFEDVNLSTMDLEKDHGLQPLLDIDENVSDPSLSPNGQWLAYYRNVATPEVDLRPFPGVAQQRRVIGRGLHPVFSADGTELFAFDGEGLSVARIDYSPLRVGALRKLFSGPYWYGVGGTDGNFGRAWDVDSKNNRFLMITLPEAAPTPPAPPAQVKINVVLNWFDELERRLPKR